MSSGLVLTGGGARGAWQAGLLRAIAEIHGRRALPFEVVVGTSAGSINAAFLAARADDFPAAAAALVELWTTLTPARVFRTDAASLAKIGASWMADLGLGGFIGAGRGRALLDTAPLGVLLDEVYDPARLAAQLAAGRLDALAVSATRYDTGLGVTFHQSRRQVAPWTRRTRRSQVARIGVEHVLASSAIPVFFPAVQVDGAWYGDGCVRMNTPLSPAIHLGADHLLAIGVQRPVGAAARSGGYPSKAATAGLLLDALFLDALDADIERAERINRTLSLLPDLHAPAGASGTALRPLSILALQPETDLGALGRDALGNLPGLLRHLLRGLGADAEEGWELVSYLAFEPGYTGPLVEDGYRYGMGKRAAIRAWLDRAAA